MHAGRAARSQAGPGIGRCGHGDCLRGDEGRIDAGAGVQGQVQGVGKGIAPNSKLGHCEIRNQLNIEERFKARRWGPLRMTARIEGMMPTRREHSLGRFMHHVPPCFARPDIEPGAHEKCGPATYSLREPRKENQKSKSHRPPDQVTW